MALLLCISCAACVRAQGIDAGDRARIEETRRIIALYGNLAWPGWKDVPPCLIRKGAYDYLVGHPSPPRGFEPLPGPGIGGYPISRRAGHIVPAPAATTWEVGGRWSLAIPAIAEFQAAIDEQLGAGAVVLDDRVYVRAAVHEAFHAFQMESFDGPGGLPDIATGGEEAESLIFLSQVADLDSLQAEMGRALQAGIEADTQDEAREAAARWLGLRRARAWAAAPAAAYEEAVEWTEGTARYAETKALILAALMDGSSGEQGQIEARTLLEEAFRPLSDPGIVPGLRDRYAAFGAGMGFLLDKLWPAWKERAVPGGAALESLIAETLAAGVPAALPLSAMPRASISLDGERLVVALADRPELWRQGLSGVEDLGRLDGMLFDFGNELGARFGMEGALIPLDIAFFDGNGVLIDTLTMPVSASDPGPSYAPDRPFRYALEAPAGRLGRLSTSAALVIGERSGK